jgi:hypothetical protein
MCIRPAMCGRHELVSSVEIAFRDGYGVLLHPKWKSMRLAGVPSCDNADSTSTRARIALGVGEDIFRREADDAL